jgi:hypothetical protein
VLEPATSAESPAGAANETNSAPPILTKLRRVIAVTGIISLGVAADVTTNDSLDNSALTVMAFTPCYAFMALAARCTASMIAT